ncbi:MAG TPA: hypothetical protein VN799_05580 [Acidimicrobiales bacterium]|nr:hypothetical protein [Acidimicrobiales bacterium]
MNVSRSFVRLVSIAVVVSMPLLGMSGVASAAAKGSQKWCAHHSGKAAAKAGCATTGGGGTGGPPPVTEIQVTVSPNPVIETGVSEIHAVVQVEAQPSFAGDNVFIYSQQLINSCEDVNFKYNEGVDDPSVSQGESATVPLDNDGNVTVELDATECAPGPSLVEADLVAAPYYTATTTLQAQPPNVTPEGLTAFPNPEVETGDGTYSGSNVYAVFYFEDAPVYAETPVEISSAQLQNRCLGGETWDAGNGGSGDATGGTTTLDNDGNAVFIFEGISCAPGDSVVVGDGVKSGDTFTTTYTITAPTPTVA